MTESSISSQNSESIQEPDNEVNHLDSLNAYTSFGGRLPDILNRGGKGTDSEKILEVLPENVEGAVIINTSNISYLSNPHI